MSTRLIAATTALAVVASGCGLVAGRAPFDPAAEQAALAEDEVSSITIELARFFGDCEDATLGVTDVTVAASECEVIQILTNKFNAENPDGIDVTRLGGAQFAAYYDTLNATYAGGQPPDVAVMHAANLPDYASRNLLVPLDDVLADAGIDIDDFTEPAREGVTYEGRVYGVPFDVHTNLWHVNVDLFAEAGLVDEAGEPILPSSPDEFFEQARQIEEATGAQYFATDANQFALSVMMFLTLLYQQGGAIVAEDGASAALDGPEAQGALEFMQSIFDEGVAEPTQDYTAAQTAFLNGDAAVLHNGTWVVNQYAADTPFEYRVAPFPTIFDQPAAWANSHVWVLPAQRTNERYRDALEFITFLAENDAAWAIGTGHLPSIQSVLASSDFEDAPQRSAFAEGAVEQARLLPQVGNWQPIEDVLKTQVESTWLTGASPAEALNTAQNQVSGLLESSEFARSGADG